MTASCGITGVMYSIRQRSLTPLRSIVTMRGGSGLCAPAEAASLVQVTNIIPSIHCGFSRDINVLIYYSFRGNLYCEE